MQNKRYRRQMLKEGRKLERPFEKNIQVRDNYLAVAGCLVQEAVDALQNAAKSAEHWADFETIEHFSIELEKWLSDEDGATGFKPTYIDN